jgi:tetratricopeptide (TPR) repeat protein
MGALDELLARWRENPDSGTTLALCTYLGTSAHEELIREVGQTAEAWHKDDAGVMLAVGRMYLDALLLQEAQGALVAAGRLDQTSPAPYRYLGEVLLRRGDAARAEKVLARALQMGAVESDTRMWHDRSTVYVALQARMGMRAVADEIARTLPKRNSIPPPTMTAHEAEELASRGRPKRAGPKLVPSVPPPPKFASQPAPRLVSTPAPPLPSYRSDVTSDHDAPTGRFNVGVAQSRTRARDAQPILGSPASSRAAVAEALPPPAPVARERYPAPLPVPSPVPSPPPRMPSPPPPLPASAFRSGPAYAPDAAPPAPFGRAVSPPPPPRSAPPSPRPAPRSAPPALPGAMPPAARVPVFGQDDSPTPAAETILDHLARVGVFERNGGARPAWSAPERVKQRGAWLFVAATVLAIGGGVGAFRYVHGVRAQRMDTARRIEADVAKLLETAKVDDLAKTDAKLSEVFELDSRSQTAAVLWLRNRVLSALMLPGEPRGIESALARCKTLDVDESKTAFGKLASFLAEGDLAGAAAIMPKWDEKAKGDPFYHLAAAAMLERAGDVRAVGQYQQAFELDPDLLVARVFHAELVTLELGIGAGKSLIADVTTRLGDGPVSRALRGLSWAVDPDAGELPEDAKVAESDGTKLPTQLLAIPYVVDARVATREGRSADALAALDKALRVTATPAMATGIGQLAIDLGDEALARQATLRALSYSALYPRARSLAARVALLGAHIDEAKHAIQELDAKSPEVAVVRAAAAYESLDLSELESAVQAMGATDITARALSQGPAMALGRRYPDAKAIEQMAVPQVPWGDLVAVDAALDTGKMDLAQKIAARWGTRSSVPTYALRLARLLRYQGKTDDGVKASADAMVPGGVTPRVLVERFDTLLAAKDFQGARDLLAQYPIVLGPMTELLKVSLDAADNKLARAKAAVARLEPPPEGSPVLYDLIAARAFAAAGDLRAKAIVMRLLRSAPHNPDVVELHTLVH